MMKTKIFHLFSAMALSNLWTNYTGQAIFCAVFGMTSGAYVRTHHMFSRILNFLFVIVFLAHFTKHEFEFNQFKEMPNVFMCLI